jgi:hypothetical protein
MKIQFITSNSYPDEVNVWFGSTVSARSVRLISLKTNERDNWWAELREEITKNARSLSCTHILGYREVVSIYEDVIVLNVFGTAVKIMELTAKQRREIIHRGPNRMKSNEGSPLIESLPLSKL